MIIGNPITLGGGGKAKKLLSSLTEGSLVSVLEDGKLTPFYVAKHNYEADLNGEGRTLLVRKDVHSNRVWDADGGKNYGASDLDVWFNGDYKDSLSNIVKGHIGVTEFPCAVGNGNTTLTAFSRSVFALSFRELNFTNSGGAAEGSPLPIANVLKVAYLNGVASEHWLRSPHVNMGAFYMTAGGDLGAKGTNTSCGVRPCFTLPADIALRDEPYADGVWGLADEDILFDTETASTTAKAGVNYTNGIADLTPAQLHEIAAAISCNPNIDKDSSVVYYDKGDVHRKISTGDTMDVDVNGTSTAVNILGFNHDDLTLGAAYGLPTATGKAGMTFQTVDCYTQGKINASKSNTTGWTSCYMRTDYMTLYANTISAEIKGHMKSVKKLTSAGNKSPTINTTEDRVFLLSEIEVCNTNKYSFAGEGAQYAYYKAGNSAIKTTKWWLRSPSVSANAFAFISATGVSAHEVANISQGIAFAYCI